MAEITILTPDQVTMSPGTRGYVKDLTVMHVHEGPPYINFLESAPHHYAQVHSHSEDEIMVVVKGRMFFNGRWCEVGSLIFVPAHEEYWYSTGDEACRVALVRPGGRGTFQNGRQDEAGDPAKPKNVDDSQGDKAADAPR